MSVIDQVKERLDITELVGRHVRLQKSGRYLKGLCPFHTEKTPSFYVFPDDQRWHCFGCQRGGDIFNFVMEMNGYDFRTALEELARQANVTLREQSPQEAQTESEAERLRALLTAAVTYYHTLLMTAPQAAHARAYLRDRGFTKSTVETFQLGYSMDAWDAGRTHLIGQGYTVEEQVKAGMLIERDDGSTYDRFRDRIMIPIHDRRGRPIAFGGRVLQSDQQPKYLNSPQTILFDKGQVLFGYHLASRAIRDQDAAVIVEGYMDVMIPHQAGFRNVVAPMGTALSEAHLAQLQRLTHHYILALDPDAAGVHGTLQGLETARQTLDRSWEAVFDPRGLVGYEGRLKADIRVMTLPAGLDPDELVLQDPARWEALVAASQPVVRFYFNHMLAQEKPDEPKAKSRIIDAMLPLLNDIGDSIEREAYTQEIAQRLGVDARGLLDRLRAMDRAEAVKTQVAVRGTTPARTPTDLEAHVLSLLIRMPDLKSRVDALLTQMDLEPLGEDDFPPEYRLIWVVWAHQAEHPNLELADSLPSDMLELVEAWHTQALPDMTPAQWERDIARTVLRMRDRLLRQELQRANGNLGAAKLDNELEVVAGEKQTVMRISDALRKVQSALARRSALG
ncbi:MAG: DNA primase [Anaerolineae bacterium]|jgi:DNA primase|nr:DNA primase [Anaerolineae bacterium]